MNVKEYLSQAYRIDRRIDSKLSQIQSLRELASKATSTITSMPRSPSPNLQPIETIVARIAELEGEIVRDIDLLIDVKTELYGTIKRVGNIRQQMLLELRYLCFNTWEQIAEAMGINIRWTHRLHTRAVEEFTMLTTKSH